MSHFKDVFTYLMYSKVLLFFHIIQQGFQCFYIIQQGFQCFQLSNTQYGSFPDVDECKPGFNQCSHTCKNMNAGHVCLCPAGMVVGSDHRTCEGMITCALLDYIYSDSRS